MTSDKPVPNLSPREHQLLKYAAEGLTDMGIANKLGISEATVGTYWGRVRVKLGPFSRTELVAIMIRTENEALVETLRRENHELLSQLRQAGESSEVLPFKEVIESAPDAMIVVDHEGRVVYANAAGSEMFGGSLSGLHIRDLVPSRFVEGHQSHIREYFSNPSRRPMGAHIETPARDLNGCEFLIRAALAPVDTVGGSLVVCIIRPKID